LHEIAVLSKILYILRMAKFIKLIKDFDKINISLKKQEAIKGAPKRIKGIKQLQ
jgi:hypothetical protein